MIDDNDGREQAIRRLTAKREFTTHLVIYMVVNVALVGVWLASGAGYFWPIWSIGGWGVGLFFHWWNAYRETRPMSEDEIEREMRRASR